MAPRLYMQDIQYAFYKSDTREVVFQTRHISGGHYYFVVSNEQFLSLDDAITLIENSSHYGDIPLGGNVWFRYHENGATLYRDTANGSRSHFHFENFNDYKNYTHQRIYSLVTCLRSSAVTRRRRHGHFSKTHKRPLSNNLQSANRPCTSKRNCRLQWEVSSRSPVHDRLSNNEETSTFLPEWNDSAPWGEYKSPSSSSNLIPRLVSPSPIQLSDASSSSSMESE